MTITNNHIDKARKELAVHQPKFISVIWSAAELTLIRQMATEQLSSLHRGVSKCQDDALPFCPPEHFDMQEQEGEFIQCRQHLIIHVNETIEEHNLEDFATDPQT